MVPIMRLFRNLPALFALVCAATGQGADTIYRKVGDSVVLNPGQPFNAISSATWKHNTDLASEWFGTGNVDCYRDFKGRCSLNTTDGSFTISNLKVEDSGSYTPEINDKVLTALKLQVIEPVPKPTVSVKCNNEKTLCNLTCEANVSAEFGLVIYRWRNGEEVLSNDKELIITENKESSFICELKNPVSSSSSDGVDNPLSRGNPGAEAGLAGIIVVLIVAVVLAVVGRILYYKRKNGKRPTFKEFWCCNIMKTKGQYAPVPRKDTNTKKNHEPNGGRSTPTVQTINENEDKTSHSYNKKTPASEKPKEPDCDPSIVSAEVSAEPGTSISGSAEEHEQNPPPVNSVPSGPTEDNDLSNNGKKTDDLDKEQAEDPSSKNQGDSSTGKQLTTASETNISQSTEEANQNPPPVNPVPSGPTEDNDSLNNDKKTDDQDKEQAEDPSSKNQGDSSTVEQTTKASEGEASPRDNEEKAASEKPKDPDCDASIVSAEVSAEPETNISESSEEREPYQLASETLTSGPTEGEAPPKDNKEKDGSGEEDKPFYQASDKLTSGPTEGEAPPKDNKEKDGTSISESSKETEQLHVATDLGTSGLIENSSVEPSGLETSEEVSAV